MRRLIQTGLKIVGWVIVGGVVVWFGFTVYLERAALVQQLATLNLALALCALLLVGVVLVAEAQIWRGFFQEFNHRFSFTNAFQILYISNLAKYIPGRIWQLSSAIYFLYRSGIPPEEAAAISLLAQLTTIVAGTMIALSALAFWLNALNEGVIVLASGILFALSLMVFILFPSWWIATLNRTFQLLKRPPLQLNYSRRLILKYILLYLGAWLILGSAFFALVLSLYPVAWSLLPLVIAAFVLAYLFGYLVIFVPGGLGIRESILVLTLSFILPVSVATAAALLSRVLFSLVEFLFAGVSLWSRSTNRVS